MTLLAAVTVTSSGCSVFEKDEPTFRPPPSAGRTPAPGAVDDGSIVIVMGRFDDPRSMRTPLLNVGDGVGRALGRTLGSEPGIDVWTDPALVDAADQVGASTSSGRQAAFESLRREHPGVRYILNGAVTDFHHLDAPQSNPIESLLGDSGHRAVVALEFSVLDLQAEREILSDHIFVRTEAEDDPLDETYGDVSIDSYLFWSTPLGRATGRAIERIVFKVARTVGGDVTNESIRVVSSITDRRVRVANATGHHLHQGDRFYVCRFDISTGHYVPLTDHHSRLPLMARIEETGATSTTAWIQGRPGPDTTIRGAVLLTALPTTPDRGRADDLVRATPGRSD